ncbi:PRD domain protein [Enterococcus faecalis 02-MB-P-10]|uniref:PRD domain-containing protein n=1 Tax=Enterococcus faecalis TaxID=1351 RepID=UPI000352E50B|nr:PRD domain-containing protein [Enterococcus faecalis]EPH78034.1 PRD domain protein [Enterococcus faecalis 02-MB-P-10]
MSKLEFIKKINNNVAFAKDDSGTEYVVLGKGIGFSPVAGDILAEDKIDRRYILKNDLSSDQDIKVLSEMPSQVVELTTKVSQLAKETLDIEFDNAHYLILADHIDYAIKRRKEGIDYPVLNYWELRKIHPQEFELATKSLALINESLGFELDESEKEFLTNHFVNASNKSSSIGDTVQVIKLIKQIVKLVEYQFQISLNPNLFAHGKFVNHLRYFLLRKLDNQSYVDEMDDDLVKMYQMKYPKEYQMAEKIEEFLQMKEDWWISEEEKIYLTVHLKRIKQI